MDRDIALAFALRLRHRREAANLTQEKAAEAAGMSRNHYQLLESGLSDRAKNSPANPRLSTLMDLARILGCEVGDLADGLRADLPDRVGDRIKVDPAATAHHRRRTPSA